MTQVPVSADILNVARADVLSVAQVAGELNLTERAVRHRIKAGTLAATKLGPGTAAYVITRAEVERVKAERRAS